MGKDETVVTVVGTGTIGEPLISLLSLNKKNLGIDRVLFHKRTPALQDRTKVLNLVKKGAEFVTDPDRVEGFKSYGVEPSMMTEDAMAISDVVIDCTPKGVGFENKKRYYERHAYHAKGYIAQGSEFGFGVPYARGINDDVLEKGGKEKFIQVVSCNTHNLSVIVKSIGLDNGVANGNLDHGHFLCIRRANDVSNESGMLAGPEAGVHHDETFGTHHARDVFHIFKTLGLDLNLFSSAVKVPTQYMHTIYFHLRLKDKVTRDQALQRWNAYPYSSITHKKLVNMVYSFGRDHGHYGRLLDEGILVEPSLWVSPDGHEVAGYCFTPQDGNSLLSSLAATSYLLDPSGYREKMTYYDQFLHKEV